MGTERESLERLFAKVRKEPTCGRIRYVLNVAWLHILISQGLARSLTVPEAPEHLRHNVSRLCNHLALLEETVLFLKSLHPRLVDQRKLPCAAEEAQSEPAGASQVEQDGTETSLASHPFNSSNCGSPLRFQSDFTNGGSQ